MGMGGLSDSHLLKTLVARNKAAKNADIMLFGEVKPKTTLPSGDGPRCNANVKFYQVDSLTKEVGFGNSLHAE